MKKPTVTQLLDLLNKPALMEWANKIGLSGQSLGAYRAELKNAGISIHSQAQRFLQTGEVFDDPIVQGYFEQFISGYEPLGIEESIETEYFRGRYDLKVRDKVSGKSILCDIKSSKRIYFENKLQLAAYRMAEPSDSVAVIHAPDFRLEVVEMDFPKYEEILIALNKIWVLKSEINEK